MTPDHPFGGVEMSPSSEPTLSGGDPSPASAAATGMGANLTMTSHRLLNGAGPSRSRSEIRCRVGAGQSDTEIVPRGESRVMLREIGRQDQEDMYQGDMRRDLQEVHDMCDPECQELKYSVIEIDHFGEAQSRRSPPGSKVGAGEIPEERSLQGCEPRGSNER